MRIGFIGIGIMGRGMAMNLVKKGFDVTVGGPSPFARCTCAIAPRDAPITYCRGGPAAACASRPADDAGMSAVRNVAGPSGAQLPRPRQ